jgi:hypothetical protein
MPKSKSPYPPEFLDEAVRLARTSGKPIVLYVGGEFCPYSAAERWSPVVALSRFGAFSNLALLRSSSTDMFPDTRRSRSPAATTAASTWASRALRLKTVTNSPCCR